MADVRTSLASSSASSGAVIVEAVLREQARPAVRREAAADVLHVVYQRHGSSLPLSIRDSGTGRPRACSNPCLRITRSDP